MARLNSLLEEYPLWVKGEKNTSMSTALNVASSPGPVQNLERGLVILAKFIVCAESAYYVHIQGIFVSGLRTRPFFWIFGWGLGTRLLWMVHIEPCYFTHIHVLTSPLALMSGSRDGGKSLIPSKWRTGAMTNLSIFCNRSCTTGSLRKLLQELEESVLSPVCLFARTIKEMTQNYLATNVHLSACSC